MDWGIPELDPAMQAERLVEPTVAWGSIARSRAMPGTYHFYVPDRLFSGLVKAPGKLVNSGCYAATEVNFSTWPEQPRIEAAYHIYIKRRTARMWQDHGVRIWVDLNIDDRFWDMHFWGVPEGWRAYATRKVRGAPLEYLDRQWLRAIGHAGTKQILFWVHGGHWTVREHCEDRGWLWTPETAVRALGSAPPSILLPRGQPPP